MKNVKILAVDDNRLILRFLEVILRKDYEVFTTSDTLSAINRLHNQDIPDLIITDIKMPLMSGGEFITYLNRIPNYKDIPVLIISGYSKEEIEEECPNMVMNFFLRKPLDPVQLEEKIKWIFHHSQ